MGGSLGQGSRPFGLGSGIIEGAAQAIRFRRQRGVVLAGVRWRDEGTGIEGAFTCHHPVIPDAERAGIFQTVEGGALVAGQVMGGGVAGLAELMEEFGRLSGDHAPVP